MKKLLAALGISLFLATTAVFGQDTKSTLQTSVTTNFPDNTTGLITPAILRSVTNSMILSWQQAPRIRANTAASDTITAADYGLLVTENNVGAVAVSLPQATGSFATFNYYQVNLGVGLVTITPAVSTINGAATYALSTGQSAYIISDGTNYQVWPGAAPVTCASLPAFTGDVTKSSGSCALTAANLPTAIPMAGSLLATNIAAPGTPAAGKTSIYVDSTDKRLHDKNDAGAIGTTVVADTGASNNFLTAVSAAGVISKAQPSISNLSGFGTSVATALAINVGSSGGIARTIASGSKALATGAISSAACTSAQTATATGTLTTDAIAASFNGDPTAVTGYVPLTTGMLTIIVYPTADTVNFKVCNNTGSSITPGAITLNWHVIR